MVCFEDRQAPFVDIFRRSAEDAGYALTLCRPDEDPGFARFRAVYRHRSVNSEAFELACFRRYFALAAALAPDERAILADSDLIVQDGPDRLPGEIRDFAGLVGSIGRSEGLAEDDVSPHFSIWSGRQVRSFCDYLIATYRDRPDTIERLYRERAARGRAAISDMTLIGLWCREAGIPLLDSNRLFGHATIDHNISMAENAETRFATAIGRKRLYWRADGIWFETADGRPVRPIAIHLQGRYKRAARAVAQRQWGQVALISAWIALGRTVRSAVRA